MTFQCFASINASSQKCRFQLRQLHWECKYESVHEILVVVAEASSKGWEEPNGVARMLKKLRTSGGDYWNKQWFTSIASIFFEMGTSLEGKNSLPAPRGSEFFPLRAVPFGMENQFHHIRWPPLSVTIFITHVHNYIMVATPIEPAHPGSFARTFIAGTHKTMS